MEDCIGRASPRGQTKRPSWGKSSPPKKRVEMSVWSWVTSVVSMGRSTNVMPTFWTFLGIRTACLRMRRNRVAANLPCGQQENVATERLERVTRTDFLYNGAEFELVLKARYANLLIVDESRHPLSKRRLVNVLILERIRP